MLDFEVGKSYYWTQIRDGKGDLIEKEYGEGVIGKQAIHLTDDLDFDVWFVYDSWSKDKGGIFKCVYNNYINDIG